MQKLLKKKIQKIAPFLQNENKSSCFQKKEIDFPTKKKKIGKNKKHKINSMRH